MIVFDLFENTTPVGKDIKDVATKAAVVKARMAHPTATSDIEALAKDMLDTQAKDEHELAQAQEINDRQDELLQKIQRLDRRQDNEIDDVEAEENDLQAQIKYLQSANARLTQTLANMRGKKKEEPAEDLTHGLEETGEMLPEDDVEDFIKAGGKIQQVKPQRGPRRPGLTFGSKHIGTISGSGKAGKMSGSGANVGGKGKPVVSVEGKLTK